jgi:NADH dehydrogenase [ubiquinone] 1 alpha subcomplex assembly factor 7
MSQKDGGELSLAERFRRLIAESGPISVQHFMGESNARYYAARDPLGAAGDFVTAPEISQMFGELIGLALTDLWHRAGPPQPIHYVELGPGRGTLASDALRAMAQHGLTPQVHLLEGSPALRRVQHQVVPNALFHDDLGTLPDEGPLLFVANEFLDALPIRQLVRTEGGWRERMVGLDEEGAFAFFAGSKPMDAAIPPDLADAAPGTILETCPAAAAMVEEVARLLARQGGAALFIDYGHAEPRTGSTLQAVRRHTKVGVLAAPGEADLTAHVDFAAAASAAERQGARWLGTVEQGTWLRALGIEQRAAALSTRFANRSEELASAVQRLAGPAQMGTLFKVMGLSAPQWPGLAGFPPPGETG